MISKRPARVLDAHILIDAALELDSKARGVLVTGSSVIQKSPVAGDIDLIVLSPSVPEGLPVETGCRINAQDVNIVIYNDLFFCAVATNPDLVFYFLREIRRFLAGQVLVDDGAINRNRFALERAMVSESALTSNFRIAKCFRAEWSPESRYSLDFYRIIETLTLVRLHMRIEGRFSKHKYLLEDIERLNASPFERLLKRLAESLAIRPEVSALVRDVTRFATLTGTENKPNERGPLHDAVDLLANGRRVEAVPPLRYFLLKTYYSRAMRSHEQESTFSRLLERAFFLLEQIPPDIMKLLDECLAEVERMSNIRHRSPSDEHL